MTIKFKEEYLERYKKLLKDELQEFLKFNVKPLVNTIRFNTLKMNKGILLERLKEKGWKLKELPWFELGFYVIEPKYQIGNSLEHRLGYFYIQGPASMVPPIVLNPKPYEVVLDMCAAPGSKTTQIAAMMENKGIIVANDVELKRITALRSNLQRCGVINTVVTMMDGRRLSGIKQKFDKVLLDAPCTGDGTIRMNPEVMRMWSVKGAKALSRLQRSLILSAFDTLKGGGILVYSTCSLNPEEDEYVVDYLIKKRENARIESIRIDGLKFREGLTEFEGMRFDDEISKTIRIYPHDNDTEGFFIAKVMKVG
ncbi:MAG: NOL1/NOP2/sun family putative RNA methylase [Candidatus Asgardarchaeia archaeon]